MHITVDRTETMFDEELLPALLRRFYARVRQDETLGPVFNAAIEDWDEHLERIGDFWSSVLLGSGRYKGNPLAMHLLHKDLITPEMFDRWLALWALTTGEMLPPPTAAALQAKAARIADTLKWAMRLSGGEASVLPTPQASA